MSSSRLARIYLMVRHSCVVHAVGRIKPVAIMINPIHSSNVFCITLLRHGESQGNFEGRHQGQADFPLTDLGRQQTKALVDRWKVENKTFDLIISSPLVRARETAEIIAAELKFSMELDPLWMERDNGLMAGVCAEEVPETPPPPDFIPPHHT